MYSTRTRIYTRASPADILARKSARPDKSRTCRRAERAASAAERPATAHAGHADFLARILAQKSARKSVLVLWHLANTQDEVQWLGSLVSTLTLCVRWHKADLIR